MSFAWSYSRLKNFETCPKRYHEIDILKNFHETSEQLDWGDAVHKAMAAALRRKHKLPDTMQMYQEYINEMLNGKGELLVEQRYAITKDFQPCDWMSPRTWYRGIGDAVLIDGEVGLIRDWKTGKVKKDPVQLFLMAQCLFCFHKELKKVMTQFVWLGEETTTDAFYTREEMAENWPTVLRRLIPMEKAADTLTYPPTPGGLCKKYCPVNSCPFWKKGTS